MFVTIPLVLLSTSDVYGHGSGVDTIRSIYLQEKELSIDVELPTYFEDNEKQLTVTATYEDTGQTVKNITYLIGVYYADIEVFRDHFFAANGILTITTKPNDVGEVQIYGQQIGPLNAWYGDEYSPLEITGPVFDSGGLYTFEIEIKTIDEQTNILDSEIYYADLTLVDTLEFFQDDSKGSDVKFRVKSYFDKISNFEYDSVQKQLTFDMPFDWSEKRMSHIPVVHVEVHFPKEFEEFLHLGYEGQVNGIDLFRASVTIDDYTEDDERIVHFVLLQDHLRFLKNQQESLPSLMSFTLSHSEDIIFPLTAFTKSEDFRVDFSWDPLEIEPDKKTNFIFTIRDGSTGEPLRNSDYTFVILQNGQEIHRVSGQAQVGGDFESYEFAEDQTGPTTIRFENIRNSGQETEFSIVVAPEFGSIMLVILAVAIMGAILLGARRGPYP